MSKLKIDADLVRRLVAEQFPQWAHLPIRPVARSGWDNRTFHLGETMSVRLPSHPAYAPQVEKEQRWLLRLARQLPLPIPEPIARGRPTADYPLPWSIYRWLDGEPAAVGPIEDWTGFARDLAGFLRALQAADPSDGPPPGPHSFLRGGPVSAYDGEAKAALAALAGRIDPAAAGVWDAALAAPWSGPPVWVHGDVAAGNLLVRDGRLAAVIDFGCSAVGDPACDLVVAWTLLDGDGREAFREAIGQDAATWGRARGWALWKALIMLAGGPPSHVETAQAPRVLEAVIADHRAFG